MKKVRMLIGISGLDFSYHVNQETELSDELAEVWNEIGHCEILEEEDTVKNRAVKKYEMK